MPPDRSHQLCAAATNGASTASRSPRGGAVASPHWAATEAGASMLAAGGTALDAAVATNAVLAVVYPHMCGIGGDAFMLHYEAATGEVTCLNGSGPAPELASVDAFRDRGLSAVPPRGPLAATVPGTLAAWDGAHARFGSLPLATLLAPAIAVADDGVEVSPRLAAWIAAEASELRRSQQLSELLLSAGGRPLPAGTALRQPQLARTLRRLADAGLRDFYDGEIAARIDEDVRRAGGLLRAGDLRRYAPEWQEPLRLRYRGLDIVTTPPNSQGVASLLMLNALAELEAERHQPGSAEHVEALVAAKRVAIAARDRHLCDPACGAIPLDRLLSRAWAREALAELDAAPAAAAAGPPVGGDTVYLCTVDAHGNACSLIQSVYYPFGSCFVAGDTGVLLHNRGHYFSLADGHPNCIAPRKRPVHTLMASMALADGRPRFVYGSMGGDGQPLFNVQVLERLLAGEHPQAAVAAPRVLHGRFVLEDDPSLLHVEADAGEETLLRLRERGHRLAVTHAADERMGHAHAIRVDPDGTLAVGADPRSDGDALVVA